ncbi:MAG: NifU family protein, partial [Chloroflexi bacterium]|nr:NifU family protein [Chloroflexota bacterium]
MLAEDRELTERAAKLEALLDEIEAFPDPTLRAKTAEIVQDLLLLYGEGLARMLAIVREAGGERILGAFAD